MERAEMGRCCSFENLKALRMNDLLKLPTEDSRWVTYKLAGNTPVKPKPGIKFNRIAYSAAHVVSDPLLIGMQPLPIAVTCGLWDLVWRKPWTPLNVEWGWIGRPPWS